MTIFRQLPEDLVEEILSHVPATHLKRLRSTCKRWNLLFNNRRFATKAKEFMTLLLLTKDSRICPVSLNLHGIVPSLEVISELSLIDPRSYNSHQLDICGVFHCDGLLLCTSFIYVSRLVVWNPCTGQTRWIEDASRADDNYVLGYSKSSTKTYKVLSFSALKRNSKIYDFSSDSWRFLDHDISPGWYYGWSDSNHIVSLKGNAYWFTTDETLTLPGIYLRRFDFTSEKSSLLVRLPYQGYAFETASLSVVRDEKLSVLLQPQPYSTSKTEIWVTNKIDETKPVSWTKLLVLDLSPDLQISSDGTFLLDEEKKVALCCERWTDLQNPTMTMDKIYCVGEGVTQVYLRDTMRSYEPAILNYVPSLVQIEPVGGNKRRRVV